MILTCLIALVLGLALLRRGWRGRTLNDHPCCSSCQFDLVGTPQAERCPECGADLSRAGAWLIGQRSRRPLMIGAGALALVFGAFLSWGLLSGTFRDTNWNKHKPHFWLDYEVGKGSDTTRYLAGKELIARAQAGKLKGSRLDETVLRFMNNAVEGRPSSWIAAEQLTTLLNCPAISRETHQQVLAWVMDLQADDASPFPPCLGDLVLAAFWNGQVTEEEFRCFLARSCRPTLRAVHGGKLSPGEELIVEIDWNWKGANGPLEFLVNLPVPAKFATRFQYPGWFGGVPGWQSSAGGVVRTPQSPGRYTITGSVRLGSGTKYLKRGYTGLPPALSGTTRPLSSIPEVAVEFPLRFDYEIVEAADDVETQRLRNRVASMFHLGDSLVMGRGQVPKATLHLFVYPFADQLALEFDALWRYSGREMPLGSAEIAFTPGSATSSFSYSGESGRVSQGSRTWGGDHVESMFDQINIGAPVPDGGQGRGTLVLTVRKLVVMGESIPVTPFTIDLPDVRILR